MTKKMVKFVGSSIEQVRWGSNDDPDEFLRRGKKYELLREEVHSWHTKYVLRDFPDKKFNSSSFAPSRVSEGWNEYNAEAVAR
jgi:hypothetical protein